jgi:hypothetical protein
LMNSFKLFTNLWMSNMKLKRQKWKKYFRK